MLGKFSVGNPSLGQACTWNFSPDLVQKGITGKYAIRGKTYKTEYSGALSLTGKFTQFKDKRGIVGKVDKNKFEDHQMYRPAGQNRHTDYLYYTTNAYSAFDKSVPYFVHDYLGDKNGAKTWEFIIKDWDRG